ncbi:N6-adenosine-methyltransferase TMT1A-like isoform X2 [Neocloeon triangulifer]|uniref:N6-adenosine-methyltransferase TMT1A-like isoform X2 n=1 Tax=Neocloeon triangulifer TaxID=2078957 RepID=UPI00286EB687|nr:N6-adenosine-methyltransferase TMT1A-like isoform X2 [Neocloeon triangulifer]
MCFFTFATVCVVLFGLGFLFKNQIFVYKEKKFADFINRFMALYNTAAKVHKERLFAELRKIKSKDPQLQKEGKLRILEVGCGSEHLPKGSHLIMLDPNESFRPLLERNLQKHPSLKLERFVLGKVEEMSSVRDESVDAVVCTLVLCSVDDVAAALAEVRRVLVPGGKFIFLEHVAAERGSVLRALQWFLSASRLWPSVFCGCILNKELDKLVKNAGFTTLDLQPVDIFHHKMVCIFYFQRNKKAPGPPPHNCWCVCRDRLCSHELERAAAVCCHQPPSADSSRCGRP